MSKSGNGNSMKIGYSKPPRKHQFKKGKSGNPKGRPPKKRTEIQDIIEHVFLKEQKFMTSDGQEMTTTAIELIFYQLRNEAIKGKNIQAIRFIWQITQHFGFCDPKLTLIPPFVPSREELWELHKHEFEGEEF